MNGPARTWNAAVAGQDTPCWPVTRRHERLKACASHDSKILTCRPLGLVWAAHGASLRGGSGAAFVRCGLLAVVVSGGGT